MVWSRFLYGIACMLGVACLVTSNVGIGMVAAIVMIVALWLRSSALDVALERAKSDAAKAQERYINVSREFDAMRLRAGSAEARADSTEGALIKVTALWSRTIRPRTAPRYAGRLLALGGHPAALASAVMLSRAAPQDQGIVPPRDVVEVDPTVDVDDAPDAELAPDAPADPKRRMVLSGPVLSVVGASVFTVGVAAWWVVFA
ncbi:hypothetical protein LGT39_05915 [Demequina sp. TTPB684]|uniref:hypothetical protein n=1 Tax=unclassified Demequina TaxID=2620311 RepID=UPI001CF2755F|nr:MULTISPECIES: hypothetical protein [unclassified Demequina]MCB2412384.1 hypothetical protein [Demequina sp. TTPB684]UPU89054.1 hypothetical protein LGT36_003770 [Demequina sp. TMPB413]